MSTESTQHLIRMYVERASPVLFLTSFFDSPPQNFHTSEMVSLDIMRDSEEVAIVVQDLSAGTRENELTLWQNKGFTPPVFDESATITSYDMIRRMPGQDIFTDPNYLANATEQAFQVFRKLEMKIRRSVELMAAQVLQTGKLTLTDNAGRPLFVLDFGPRTAHFPTASADWGAGSDNPLADIQSLADQVRRDGRGLPNRLIFGKRAWRDFFAKKEVRELFNLLRINVGNIEPRQVPGGGSYKGTIFLDNYEYELYVYDGTYVDPQTNIVKEYVGTDSVIMLSEGTRLDLTWGGIPLLRPPIAPALEFLPPRISDGASKLDLTVNAYFTPDGKHLKLEAGTRPLTIPTAIDTFGCLKTRV